MKTITYILSNIDKALAFEWISEELDKSRFRLRFILLNPSGSELEDYFIKHKVPFIRITYSGKQDIFPAFYQVWKVLRAWKPDAVHCHLLDASLVGLTASFLAGIKKRIYTRHHSSSQHVYFPKAVWYDKYCNLLATNIVAISKVVSDILIEWEKANPKKVVTIHHGFKLTEFTEVDPSSIEELKKKYELNGSSPVIGVISRYTHWKGIQYIIPAFKEILKTHPSACLVLANAHGDYAPKIRGILKSLPSENYREIIFETQLGALYQLFDVFVHVPIDHHSEAFGQVYVEAMAAGIPSVFTKSGIAVDIAQHQINCLLVDYASSNEIEKAIQQILANPELRQQIITNGKSLAMENFGLSKMLLQLENLYSI